MQFLSLLERENDLPPRLSRIYAPSQAIYRAGADGLAWRVKRGVVRLDNDDKHGTPGFASLAIAGDIVGCETLLFGAYTFSASALTPCELTPWPAGEAASTGDSLLASLAQAQQRAADIVALRGGQASERVLGLIRLLADAGGRVALPTRQDIADITDLRMETISRIIKALERACVLLPLKIQGIHATRGYSLNLSRAV
jgi:CRP-like cAMP-binding protein